MGATIEELSARKKRRKTRKITRAIELVATAGEDHSILLRFLYEAIAEYDQPVKRAVLEWYVDVARPEDLDAGMSQDLFAETLDMLGPRPHREELFLMLGDLVEMGYADQTINGFGTTPMGLALLESFSSVAQR